MAFDDVIRKFADAGVTEALVKFLRAVVEGGDAEEDVGALGKDAFLGETHEARTEAMALGGWMDGEELDVAVQQAVEVQYEDADGGAIRFLRGDVGFAGGIGHGPDDSFGGRAKGEPGVDGGHEGSTGVGLSGIAEGTDDGILHGASMRGIGVGDN